MGNICDRVAVIGMGCTKFGEHWNKSWDDLAIEAISDALADAGVDIQDIEAFWLGTMYNTSGLSLSIPLKIQYKPVTRVENYCCTGSESFRNAAYAVASGAYDIVIAVGVEKLKDSGMSGLSNKNASMADGTVPDLTPPAAFSLIAPAYFKKYGVDPKVGKEVLARIAWKNHKNGALNPKAQFQREVPMEEILRSPIIAAPLGIMDCSGVCDGAAAAIIVRSEDAKKYRKDPVYIKAMTVIGGPGNGLHQDYDFTTIKESTYAAADAYKQAGITNPRKQISLAEVHDCFTPTELAIYEDLGFSERGKGWQDALNGVFDLDGELPVNPDGGLKSFGHPVGATGLRMLYEVYLQLQGKAGKRQIDNPKLGLTHNLGGLPWECVSFISIIGKELG